MESTRPGRKKQQRPAPDDGRLMFIATVLAFCAGIYVQAVHPISLRPLVVCLLAAVSLLSLFFHGPRKGFPLVLPFMLICCLLAGAVRLAFVDGGSLPFEANPGKTIFEGQVVETASRVNVLCLLSPPSLKGMRVAFINDEALETTQVVRLFGSMVGMVPTFRNPGSGSWKWEKRLEGVRYQIRGKVLSVSDGNDLIARMRRYFKRNIDHSGADHQDVLKALTIGDRTAISHETDELFMRTGTTHVLIVSGFKVSVISGFFFLMMRLILGTKRTWRLSGRASRYAAVLTIPFPVLFMLLSGSGIPVIRAVVMVVAFMIAIFLERQRHFYNTLAVATLIILLLYPYSLMTPSFHSPSAGFSPS